MGKPKSPRPLNPKKASELTGIPESEILEGMRSGKYRLGDSPRTVSARKNEDGTWSLDEKAPPPPPPATP
jgi:hypothetical protein